MRPESNYRRSVDRREFRRMYGIVVTFAEGTTREEAEAQAKKIGESATVDNMTQVEEFNPDHGGPVWYVP